jgi:hypothetical protein
VQCCVLAGCDYVNSLPTVGFATALDLVVQFQAVDADARVKTICEFLATTKGVKIPEGYLEDARLAETIFFYHPIWTGTECLLLMPRDAAASAAAAASAMVPRAPDISFIGTPPTAVEMAALTKAPPQASKGAILAFRPQEAAAAAAAASDAAAAAAAGQGYAGKLSVDAEHFAREAQKRNGAGA